MYSDDDLEEALRQRYRNKAMDLAPDSRIAGLDLTRTEVPTYPADLVAALYRGAEGAAASLPDDMTADERAEQGWKQIGMATLSDKAPPKGDDSIQESWDFMDIFPPEGMASMGAAGAKALAAKGMALKGAGMMAPALAAGEIRGVIQGGKSLASKADDLAPSISRLADEATGPQQPFDLDKAWRELQGIEEPTQSAAEKLSERGANVKKLPVRVDTPDLREEKTAYDTVKNAINVNLPARFGDKPPKGGFVYKTPVFKRKDGATVIDTYGRGDIHNAAYTLDGTPASSLKKKGGWNEPQPFPADPDDIRGNLPAKGSPIVIGAKSDPFMWMDSKYKGTQALLEDLHQYPNVTLNTRSDLIARDDYMDLLKGLDNPTINIHIPKVGRGAEDSYMESLTRQLQPGAPSIKRRLIAYKRLKDAGFNVNLIPETKLGKIPGTSKAIPPVSDIEYKAMIKHYLNSIKDQE